MRLYIVKNNNDEFIAMFNNQEDCEEFIANNDFIYGYTELVI